MGCSWEPEENLEQCDRLLVNFRRQHWKQLRRNDYKCGYQINAKPDWIGLFTLVLLRICAHIFASTAFEKDFLDQQSAKRDLDQRGGNPRTPKKVS